MITQEDLRRAASTCAEAVSMWDTVEQLNPLKPFNHIYESWGADQI